MGRLLAVMAATGLCAACGAGDGGARAVEQRPVADARSPEVVVDVAVRPLGKSSLDGFAWRRGPGRASFDRALAAEKRGDLPVIEAACREALAADPGHLEAAWMLAVVLARQGKLDQVLAPLEIAGAGDWAKWGERSLELGVFEAFRATPAGKGWVRAADDYRAALAGALADAAVVVGRSAPYRRPRSGNDLRVDHKAELYAVGGGRWIRLTRTGGGVVGALPAPGRPLIAYAAYRELEKQRVGGPAIRDLRIGVVDLATGKVGREVVLAGVDTATLGWVEQSGEPGLVVRVDPARGAAKAAAKPKTWAIDWRQGGKRATDARLRGDLLRVAAFAAARLRLPVAGITADWDDAGTASAFRIDKSRKVVAPGTALVDGHSLTWSPDGTRVAFATVAEDPCGDGAARAITVFVADAATGRTRAVGTGTSVPCPAWDAAGRLAIVDGDAVRVVDPATGKEVTRIAGGGGVATSVLGETRACVDPAPPPFAGPPVDEPPADEPPEVEVEVGDDAAAAAAR